MECGWPRRNVLWSVSTLQTAMRAHASNFIIGSPIDFLTREIQERGSRAQRYPWMFGLVICNLGPANPFACVGLLRARVKPLSRLT